MAETQAQQAVDAVIRARRTVKAFTGAPVPRAQLMELFEAARWAPNHRMSEPWRFTVLEKPRIAALAAFLASEPAIAAVPDPVKGAAKIAKLLERLAGAGALVVAGWERAGDPAIDLEDHAAAAAAVQNLLLAAQARGIASYWSTTAALMHPRTLAWCGCDGAREGCLGWLWLGTPAETPAPPPRRPLEQRVRFLDG
jgi:nitroreductase